MHRPVHEIFHQIREHKEKLQYQLATLQNQVANNRKSPFSAVHQDETRSKPKLPADAD